jgi:DNA-binding transcriptional MerR regulator
MQKSSRFPNIFFTADIASLLRIAEWRVIKFAQGAEYKIAPSHSEAAGSGSRRVYDIEDVCQIALALRLLDSGLGAKAIGEIIARLRQGGKLSEKLMLPKRELKDLYLAVVRLRRTGRGYFGNRTRDAFFVSDLVEAEMDREARPPNDLMVISVGSMFTQLSERLGKLQSERGRGK